MKVQRLRTLTVPLAAWLIAAFAFPGIASAQIVIDITNPNLEPLPIAVPVFHGVEPTEVQVAQDLASVNKSSIGTTLWARPSSSARFAGIRGASSAMAKADR